MSGGLFPGRLAAGGRAPRSTRDCSAQFKTIRIYVWLGPLCSWRVHQGWSVALRPSQRSVSPPGAAVTAYALRTCSSIGLS
jgi:hypothetical protein